MINDKSREVHPDIRFYLNNATRRVAYVTMTTYAGLTVLDQGQRWTAGWDGNLAKYEPPVFSIWTYDWDNEDDTPGSGDSIDPYNELDWEIELVQRWMKDEELTFKDLVECCDLVGLNQIEGVDLELREQAVIDLRYGLNDDIERTWPEISKVLGVTTERVKQIAGEALEKLISANDSLAFACTRSNGSAPDQTDLAELRRVARDFWNQPFDHWSFTQRKLSLDTLCYLSFLYIVSSFFDMEDPGVMEVPAGSIEVAANIDLLLGTLSRRMLSTYPHEGFSESENFDLRSANWSDLVTRAKAADTKMLDLLKEFVELSYILEKWSTAELRDALGIAAQMQELFGNGPDFWRAGSSFGENPMATFLSDEQRKFGLLVSELEAELSRRAQP